MTFRFACMAPTGEPWMLVEANDHEAARSIFAEKHGLKPEAVLVILQRPRHYL